MAVVPVDEVEVYDLESDSWSYRYDVIVLDNYRIGGIFTNVEGIAMAVIVDVIPVELMDPDRQEDVIVFIRDLPIEPEDKKRLIYEWCIYVGAVLSEEKVRGVGAKE